MVKTKTAMDFSVQAWAIHNILMTLHAAMPDDAADSEVPARCLISHVLSLTEPLATELMDFDLNARKEGGEQK